MEEDTKHPIGPMEWLDDGSDPGAPPSKRLASPPSSGLSIGSDPGEFPDPPRLITYVTHFRLRCEAFADLALDMIAEGDDDIAYGAARKAAHYGNITHGLYEQRVEELKIAHPEWFMAGIEANIRELVRQGEAEQLQCRIAPEPIEAPEPQPVRQHDLVRQRALLHGWNTLSELPGAPSYGTFVAAVEAYETYMLCHDRRHSGPVIW
jgi:hypothetical protein